MKRTAKGEAAALRPFSRALPIQLMRAREAVMQRFRPLLRSRGITEQQWRIIRCLVEVEQLEIGELSARCCLLPASLSRILPKLEADGLITRRTHVGDHRRIIVSIAPKGLRLFESIAPYSVVIYAELERVVGTERLTEIHRVLDELIEALATPGEVAIVEEVE